MGTADDWRSVCDELRGAEDPERSPRVKALYGLARSTGVAVLKRKWRYSEDDAMDVVHDVLATRLRMIVDAESPRALFIRILVNQAISRHRRQQETASPIEAQLTDSRSSASAALSLGEVLALLTNELSPRDRSVFSARCLGATAKEVAEAEGLTAANVDQIVSRARARLKELLDADPE
jgi:RNA polymerase sigma factor (sigma-70 family)